jgi:hypothetical protein
MKSTAFEIGMEELLDQWIRVLLHRVGRADGENPALVDDGDAVGHAEGEVPIMRDD